MTVEPISETDLRLIRLHCDWMRRDGASPNTRDYRRDVLRRLARALPCDLLEATWEDLDRWQSELTTCDSTTAGYTSHVRRFYAWVIDMERITVDPTRRLPQPKAPKRRPRPVPDNDLRTALVCAPEPIRTWLVLAAFMGLRCMEVAQIHRDDITELGGRMFLDGVGKGNKPFRLPIPEEVLAVLQPYLSGSGRLFRTAPGGRPSRPRDVSEQTIKFFRGIGMNYGLHRLRHSFGTGYYALTKDLLLTQQVMRHESPNTTRLYVETSSAAATAAMDQLSARLRPKTTRRRRPPEAGPFERKAS